MKNKFNRNVEEVEEGYLGNFNFGWKFRYIDDKKQNSYGQYVEEFREKLEKKGYFKNLVVKTKVYYESQVKGLNTYSLAVYWIEDSYIVEKKIFVGENYFDKLEDLEVIISLQTPEGHDLKEQHSRLKKELGEIIQRDENEK